MPVTASYRAFIIERLQLALPDVRGRDMFGGVGLYSGTTFFALIGNDVLYFKVDEQTRAQYETHGMRAFRPFGEGGEVMQYFEVPAEVIEDTDTLREWAATAVAVGRRSKQRKAKRTT